MTPSHWDTLDEDGFGRAGSVVSAVVRIRKLSFHRMGGQSHFVAIPCRTVQGLVLCGSSVPSRVQYRILSDGVRVCSLVALTVIEVG